MATDITLDSTGDFVETDDGDWLEEEKSATAVIMQLRCKFNAWPGDPRSGSRLTEMLESRDPADDGALQDEISRAMHELVIAGLISNVLIAVLDEDTTVGRVSFQLSWIDLATQQPVSLVYAPLGGAPPA